MPACALSLFLKFAWFLTQNMVSGFIACLTGYAPKA